jgi:hypothetical protein
MAEENKDPGLATAGDVEPEEQQRLEEEARENDVYQQHANDDNRKEYVHPEGARDYRVEGNDVRDYIGVDPEYMTYANETEAPILTDSERFLHTDQYDHLEGNADEDEESSDEDSADEESTDADGAKDSAVDAKATPEDGEAPRENRSTVLDPFSSNK